MSNYMPWNRNLSLLVGVMVLALAPPSIQSMDLRTGRRVTLQQGQVVSSNLYLAAGEAYLAGALAGDLTAATGEISLGGTVAHDVTIAAGKIDVAAQIGGDLRIAGGDVTIGGRVNGDLVMAGGRVRILPSAIIAGEVLLAGGDVILEGTLARSLRAVAGKVHINGPIVGPVSLRTENLSLGERAVIEGALSYFAPDEAAVDPAARVTGPMNFHLTSGMDQTWLRLAMQRFGVAFFFLRFAMALGAGLLGFFLLNRASQILISHTLENFGWQFLRGFLLFFVIPPVIFLVFITVVGVPVAFLGGLFHLSVGIVSVIYSGIVLGALLLKYWHRKESFEATWLAVIIGIPLSFLVSLVPYLGFLINATFFLAVFGTAYQSAWLLLRNLRASRPPAADPA